MFRDWALAMVSIVCLLTCLGLAVADTADFRLKTQANVQAAAVGPDGDQSHASSTNGVASFDSVLPEEQFASENAQQELETPRWTGHREELDLQLGFPAKPINYSLALMVTWVNGKHQFSMPSEAELCPACSRQAASQVANLSPWHDQLPAILAQLAAAHADINAILEPWRAAGVIEGNSGAMAVLQRDYVQAALQARARTVCEVGFNAGHGSLSLLAGSPFATALYAFDLAEHGYVEAAVDYVRRVAASPNFNANYTSRYQARRQSAAAAQQAGSSGSSGSGASWRQNAARGSQLTGAGAAPSAPVHDPRLPRRAGAAVHFFPGDSRVTLPAFRAAHPDVICDVAHVDGGHDRGIPASDLANTLAMMRPGGVIMMDDVNDACSRGSWPACVEPTEAWRAAVADGRITQLSANFPVDIRTERGWVIGVVNVPPSPLEEL